MPAYDIQDGAQARPSKLGVIRNGGMAKDKKGDGEHPFNSPFFLLHDAPQVAEAYKDPVTGVCEPTELLVYLPFATLDENMPVFHEQWSGSGVCHCKGDGRQIITLWDDANVRKVVDGMVPHMPCPGSKYESGKNGYPRCADCKPVSRLFVIVRDPNSPNGAMPVAGRWGYYQVSTPSGTNADMLTANIRDALNMVAEMANPPRWIPMILKKYGKDMPYVDKKKGTRGKSFQYLLSLELDTNLVRAASQSMYNRMLEAPQAQAALPAPQEPRVDFMTGEILDGDYSEPEQVEQEPQEPVFEPEPNTSPVTFPFSPDKKLCDFNQNDWTAFWPFMQKHTGLTSKETNRRVHAALGVESAKFSQATFGQCIEAVDNYVPQVTP